MSVPSLIYALIRAAPIIFPAHVTLQSLTEGNYTKMVGFLGGLGFTVLFTILSYTESQSEKDLCKQISIFGNSITIPAISFAMVLYTWWFLIGSDTSFASSSISVLSIVCWLGLGVMEYSCGFNWRNLFLLILLPLVGLPLGIWFKNYTKEIAKCDFNQKRFRCRTRTS